MRGQRHAPAALYPGKTRYPLYRKLGGPKSRSGQVRKISPPPGFNPRTVEPVASRCTDWASVDSSFAFVSVVFLFCFCQYSVDPALVITFQQLNWHSLTKSSNSSGDRTCILNVDYCFFYFLITGWYRNSKIQRVPSALWRHQNPTQPWFCFIFRGLYCPFRHFIM